MKSFVLLLTILLVSSCAGDLQHHRCQKDQISDENSTEVDATLQLEGRGDKTASEFRFLVSLQTHPGNHFCAGTLINTLWVLTSASCLYGLDMRFVRVKAGNHILNDNKETEQVRGVHSVFFHLYDAALIKLDSPFDTDSSSYAVSYIFPAPEEFEPDYNSLGTIIRWREIEEGGRLFYVRQQVQANLNPPDVCAKRYKKIPGILPRHICAVANGADACDFDHFDAGGPLLCSGHENDNSNEFILCGIISWSSCNGEEEYSGIYTLVSRIHNWIFDTIFDEQKIQVETIATT